MTRTFAAEWLGGPHDGQLVALAQGTSSVKLALPRRHTAKYTQWDELSPMSGLSYIAVECPVRRATNGRYYIVWKEPREPRAT